MQRIIQFFKLIGLWTVSFVFMSSAHAAQPVVDSSHIGESQKILSEAKKQTETSEGILSQTQNVVSGVEDLYGSLGDPTQVNLNALNWANTATGSVNRALKSCGIAGAIPPLNLPSLPGLDLPDLDFSCMSSALDAVESVLFTYRKIENNAVALSADPIRQNALANNRPHYWAGSSEEVAEARREYELQAVKNGLAVANRVTQSADSHNAIQDELFKLGDDPEKINNLLRNIISINVAQFEQMKELNAQVAAMLNIIAAERVHKFSPKEVEE